MSRSVVLALLVAILGTLGACATDPEVRPWWTLRDESFFPIKPGMSKADARKLLGKPWLEKTFRGPDEEAWAYRYVHGTTFYYIAVVHFDGNGAVKYYEQYPDPTIYDHLN